MTVRGKSARPDVEARQRISNDLDSTFVVEAAAGTGKTTALVRRMVATVRSGRTTLGRIAALTFTEKAAGEMKLRLADTIARELEGLPVGPERDRLERAAAEVELAAVATIHAFCADLLRERPLAAGVDPTFEVLAESEQTTVLERVFRQWFEHELSDPPEPLIRFVRRETAPRKRLFAVLGALVEHRDYGAAWHRPEVDRKREIEGLLRQAEPLSSALNDAANPKDPLCQSLRAIDRVCSEAKHLDLDERESLALVEAALKRAVRGAGWKRRGRGTFFGEGRPRVQTCAMRDEWKAAADSFLGVADAQLAADLRELLQPVLASYQREKDRLGAVDFLDLLLLVRDLLQRDPSFRRELQPRYDRIFVDEFQDTDPLQADILLLLSADDPETEDSAQVTTVPGKLFLVGDPKQSIYRFRRADIGVYDRVKRQLLDSGAELLELSTSFRSVPEIQSLINASFAPLMSERDPSVQASYVPLHPMREPVEGRPAIVCLPAPSPFGDYGAVFQGAISKSLPTAVAAFTRWLLHDSGWTIADPETGDVVAIRSEHVCLLFRRMQSFGRDVAEPYARALEERRIPLASVGVGGFLDREEVQALRMAVSAIERPADLTPIYSTLRGPFLGFTDDVLLAATASPRGLRPFGEGRTENAELDEALDLIASLHRSRNRRPIVETLSRFLEATRAHALLACWPSGALALRNLSRVLELARQFDDRSATSFRGFVRYLNEGAGGSRGGSVLADLDAGVRLMTVHSAKGLEFPVVILADPTVSRRQQPSRLVDHLRGLWAASVAGLVPSELRDRAEEVCAADDAEEVRVAYVAATRARDVLVVPTTGEGSVEGWVDVHGEALYPVMPRRRAGVSTAGCPEFGEDSVVVRGPQVRSGPRDSVKPGWYPELAGGAGAVWWDPSTLDLKHRPTGGLVRTQLLEEGQAEPDGVRAFENWQAHRETVTKQASLPSRRVSSVTARAAEVASGDASGENIPRFAIERTGTERKSRPVGPRFGTLVHAVLADAPLTEEGRDDDVRGLAEAIGRVLDAPAAEVDAAAQAARAAIAHPLFQRAAKSSDVRREVQVILGGEDPGSVVEGVIDLAFEEPSGWVVVDYKTDEGADEIRYHLQLAAYVDAVARATGRPTRGVLLLV